MTAGRLDRFGTYLVLCTFTVLALYPVLSILFLALHGRPTWSAASRSRPGSTSRASRQRGPRAVRDGLQVELHRRGDRHGRLRRALDRDGLRLRDDALRRRPHRVPDHPARDHLPVRGDGHPATTTSRTSPCCTGTANTYRALILPQIGQSVAFGTFWMRAFFRSTPRSLIEAARIDGATSFGVLWRVLHPQAWPAVLTLSLLVFVYTWNEFLLALVLVSAASRTRPRRCLRHRFAGAARAATRRSRRRGGARRTAILVVYLFLQRHFARHAAGARGGLMARIKLVYLGGGSTRAAGTMASMIANGADFEGSEVVLVDLDEDRLALIRTLAEKMARARGHDIAVTATTDAEPHSRTATRCFRRSDPVGSEARVRDERIPLDHGLIGQETQGAGGFFMALRAVAVLKDVCAEMQELCPDAWIFNYEPGEHRRRGDHAHTRR